MVFFTREKLSEMLKKQAKEKALHELKEEGIEVSANRLRYNESYDFHYRCGEYTLDKILENFEWLCVSSPFSDGKKVVEWKHESSQIEWSEFNGLIGEEFLAVDGNSLDCHLDDYLSNENSHLQSDYLNRWLVDMMMYAECRAIALEAVGRMYCTNRKLPFWRYKAKRKLKNKMSELLPHAISAYRCLDDLEVDWKATLAAINEAYKNGINWREPLPKFVSELAERFDSMENTNNAASESKISFDNDHPNILYLCTFTDRIRKNLAQIDFVFPRDLRHKLSASSADQAAEHYRSIAILVKEGSFGSAAALLRCQLECYVRSIWYSYCASDEELSNHEKNKNPESRKLSKSKNKRSKTFLEYIEEIENADQSTGSSLREHHSQLWQALNSYTHGGALSILRRVKGDRIQENYGINVIEQIAYFANFYQIDTLDHIAVISKNNQARALVNEFRIDFANINGVRA